MTLMKSLLLGSAASLLVVASAQAADLPTKKGAPAAEYVKVCKIGGVAGFIIPGSDTCLKISGYVTAQIAFGNVDNEYTAYKFGGPPALTATTRELNDYGMSTRGQVNFDAVSNTGAGPLLAHVELQGNDGTGFDALGGFVINQAYIQWAGITAGKKNSLYDFLAGGEAWFNLLSTDHSGTGVEMLAYTATFGGGFSATIDAETAENGGTYNYASFTGNNAVYSGTRSPDIIASLDVTQGWGMAHLAAVAHNVRMSNTWNSAAIDTWGWGVIGGVGINLPSLGAGDVLKLQATYTHAAPSYSGFLTDTWGASTGGVGNGGANGGQGLNMNGNGVLYQIPDAYDTIYHGWSLPTTWGAAAELELHLSPQFEIAPEIAYGAISWSNPGASMEGSAWSWMGGAVLSWLPATNLSFNLDLLYQYSHLSASANGNFPSTDPSGFNGRFRIERDF
jgi:hypothetical protein